jgi:hypothetical protein
VSFQNRRVIHSLPDPLKYDFPLPLQSRYYPMGFPVDIATNAEDILFTADQIWGDFPATQGRQAATLRVVVEDREATAPPVPSMPRGQNHLVSIVHGPDNFAMCDLARGFTFACFTHDVARNRQT